jgi:hypothetical protein
MSKGGICAEVPEAGTRCRKIDGTGSEGKVLDAGTQSYQAVGATPLQAGLPF